MQLTNYDRTIENKLEHPAAFMNYGSVYAKKKGNDLAFCDFNESVTPNPLCAVLCNRRGDYYIKKNFIDRASSDVRISCAANLNRGGRTRTNFWKIIRTARRPKMNFFRTARVTRPSVLLGPERHVGRERICCEYP